MSVFRLSVWFDMKHVAMKNGVQVNNGVLAMYLNTRPPVLMMQLRFDTTDKHGL